MWIIDKNTRSLQAKTSDAPGTDLSFIASHKVLTTLTATNNSNYLHEGIINDTYSDIVTASYTGNIKKEITYIQVYNTDSVTHEITFSITESGSPHILFVCQLKSGWTVERYKGKDWVIYDEEGKEQVFVASVEFENILGSPYDNANLSTALNSKEPTISSGTTLQYWRGDKTFQTLNTSVVAELTNLYYTNARSIASTLTGYVSGSGVISSSDTIISAIQKLNGNIVAIVSGVSSVFSRTGAVTAASGDYTTALVTESGNLYFTTGRVNTQVATYTGDVTLSGTVFSIGAGKVTNTMLAGSIAYSKLTLTGSVLNSDLANSSITINGTSISLGASGTITAAAGTLTGTTLNSTVVSSSLTSVGIIGTGTWQATSISTAYTDAKIKGSIAATAGLIPYGTGTLDILTTNTNFVFDSTNTALLIGTGTILAATDVANFVKDQNNSSSLKVRNNNASGLATAIVQLFNGTNSLIFGQTGTGFTTSGIITASASYCQATGAGGLVLIATAGAILMASGGTATRWSITSAGVFTAADGMNMAFGTTTGTKFGTATTHKMGWWNATPIIQPTTSTPSGTFVANSGTAINDASTVDGYTFSQIVRALRTMGKLA